MPQWYGAPASAPPMSFIRKGTPRKGPSGSSGESAAARARSGAAWITAFSLGFTRSMRAECRLDELAGRDGAAANQRGLLGGVEGGEVVGHALV